MKHNMLLAVVVVLIISGVTFSLGYMFGKEQMEEFVPKQGYMDHR